MTNNPSSTTDPRVVNQSKTLHVPTYDTMWIRFGDHTPQPDLPVLWQPWDSGPNVPPQFVSRMDAIRSIGNKWRWRPTGIYRELAWENMYLRYAGLEATHE